MERPPDAPRAKTEHWKRVRALFEDALERDAAGRGAWLDEACGSDAELRREVERLLALDTGPGARLDPPDTAKALAALERGQKLDLEGQQLGAYVLVRRLGSGGMGTVWLARRADQQFEKLVAVKVVKRGMDSADVLRRFAIERQLLADLDHPGVTRLLDGGLTADGRPYLVMEHVEGESVDRWCDAQRLDVRQRVELFRQICETVDYAHRRGVVHRDLKPGNVLVTSDGRPKLLDFGIAKILDPEHGADVTLAELRPLTPGYASPEQVRGEPVTPASDVYALGVVLYELLTGRRPYRATTTSNAELERVVCEEDPVRPSSAVERAVEEHALPSGQAAATPESVGASRGTTPRRLRAALEGDLDNVVLRALRKEPELRYSSAGELSADLGRLLHGLPVLARPATWRYRAGKLVRRNKLAVSAAALLLLILVAATAVSTTLYVYAEEGWSAESERRVEAERREYRARIATALAGIEARDVERARRELDLAPEEHRGWEWYHLAARLDRSEAVLDSPMDWQGSLALAPDGRFLAVGSGRGRIALLDLDTADVAHWWGGPQTVVHDLAFRPDGQVLAAAVQGHVFVFLDGDTLQPLWEWELPEAGPRSLDLDEDWRRAACGFMDGTFEVRDVATGGVLASGSTGRGAVQAVEFAPAGGRLATGTSDGRVQVWDAVSGAPVGPVWQFDDVWCLDFDPAGARLVVGLSDGAVEVLDVATGGFAARPEHHGQRVLQVEFQAGGDALVTASLDRSILIKQLSGKRRSRTLLGHTGGVISFVADPARDRLISLGEDGVLRLWRWTADDVASIHGKRGWFPGFAISPDGSLLATSGGGVWGGEPHIQVWDLHAQEELWSSTGHELDVIACRFSPDGRWLATGGKLGAWKLWDAIDGSPVASGTESDLPSLAGLSEREKQFLPIGVRDVAISPDGRRLFSAHVGGRVQLWDLERSAHGILDVRVHEKQILAMRLDRDGDRMATAAADGTARILDARTLETRLVLRGHQHDNVWGVAFAPDGRMLATASGDRSVRLWSTQDGSELLRLHGHTEEVFCVAFSPDGRRLASGSHDETLRLWDPASGEEMAVLRGHTARVADLAFGPDGRFLVSLDIHGETRIWDTKGLPAADLAGPTRPRQADAR